MTDKRFCQITQLLTLWFWGPGRFLDKPTIEQGANEMGINTQELNEWRSRLAKKASKTT